MDDTLPLFPDSPAQPTEVLGPRTVTESQRKVLRGFFDQLGLSTAREQFSVVEEITGQRIGKVQELTEQNAMMLIFQLPNRIKSATQVNTGNAWADREQNTWIDKL
jgi:hypothetical protein